MVHLHLQLLLALFLEGPVKPTSDFQIPIFVENSKELLIPTNHHWFHLIHAVGVLAYKAIIPLNLISLPLYKTSKKIRFLYFHIDNNYICSCVPSNI